MSPSSFIEDIEHDLWRYCANNHFRCAVSTILRGNPACGTAPRFMPAVVTDIELVPTSPCRVILGALTLSLSTSISVYPVMVLCSSTGEHPAYERQVLHFVERCHPNCRVEMDELRSHRHHQHGETLAFQCQCSGGTRWETLCLEDLQPIEQEEARVRVAG